MTKGLDSGAACGARLATAGCLRASAGQGCGPHGSKEPRYTGNCSKKPCSAPSAAFLQAIAIRACCGLPLQRDGSPERHRCARLLLEFVELCRWQSQCWRHGFHRCARCPLGLSEPGVGSGRALRPVSAPKLFLFGIVVVAVVRSWRMEDLSLAIIFPFVDFFLSLPSRAARRGNVERFD